MARSKLPSRRAAVTRKVPLQLVNGKSTQILATVGFNQGHVSEVFCADFKAGSAIAQIAAEEEKSAQEERK